MVAAAHYLLVGATRGRDPGPNFSTLGYLAANPDVATAAANPLVHYERYGRSEGRVWSQEAATSGDDTTLIQRSELFDPAWYAQLVGDEHLVGDPVAAARHYLQRGWLQGLDPGPRFSSDRYLDDYPDVHTSGRNPLIHFELHGRREGRVARSSVHGLEPNTATRAWVPTDFAAIRWADLARRSLNPKEEVLVLVPVFNAAASFRRCLEALTAHTTFPAHLLIVDDASDDPAVPQLCKTLSKWPHTTVIRNEANQGYTSAVNRGLERADGRDVVLLNSDAVVGPRWLEGLRLAVYSEATHATATAVSNHAGAFSVPRRDVENALPAPLSWDDVARLSLRSMPRYPTTPTGNGFCMYVKAEALSDVPTLDDGAFPRGYGEENDFCMRLSRLGWTHVVDDRTLVAHERGASFGDEREELLARARTTLARRYPDYSSSIDRFVRSRPMAAARASAGRAWRDAAVAGVVKPRVLFVIATEGGGTPQTNADLMAALVTDHEPWLLRCNSRAMTLSRLEGGGLHVVAEHRLDHAVTPDTHRSVEYDEVLVRWLIRHGIDVLHVRHLAWHSVSLIELARRLGLPVVVSLHDYYVLCPSLKLLDAEGHFCGGTCTSGKTDCSADLWPPDALAPLRHARVEPWRLRMDLALRSADALVVSTRSIQERFATHLPAARTRPVHVIPHGRDLTMREPPTVELRHGQGPRLLAPGDLSFAKGAERLVELCEGPVDLEVHVLGRADDRLRDAADVNPRLVLHGPYQRKDFMRYVDEIQPTAALILSVWAETYCHTLTECWAAGLPVVAYDLGAQGERIREHGAGWLVPPDVRGGDLAERIAGWLRDDLASRRRAVRSWQRGEGRQRTVAAMADQYRTLYAVVQDGRRRWPANLLAAAAGA